MVKERVNKLGQRPSTAPPLVFGQCPKENILFLGDRPLSLQRTIYDCQCYKSLVFAAQAERQKVKHG